MSESVDTERALREAAFRALAEHGYADLSVADIGKEFDHSPSLLYHYYEDKDDLLLTMVETLTEEFLDLRVDPPVEDAEGELRAILDQVLSPTAADVEPELTPPSTSVDVAVARVYVELWSLATWDETFRDRVESVDTRMRDRLARVVAAGVDNGEFRDVDPDRAAQHVLSLLQHALHVRATTGEGAVLEDIEGLLDDQVADLRQPEEGRDDDGRDRGGGDRDQRGDGRGRGGGPKR